MQVTYGSWFDVACVQTMRQRVEALEIKLSAAPQIDCTVGKAAAGQDPQVMMRYSNDGGINWGSWQQRSLGQIGEFSRRVAWHRLGQSRDRVWQVRCTDDVLFDVIGAAA